MALDANIANNLFTEAGSIGASQAASKVTQTLNSTLFSKLGNSTVGGAVGGFLSSQTASLIKNFLFTQNGTVTTYDPVWKLSHQVYSDPTNQTPPGDLKKATPDDFAGADHPKYKFNFTVSFTFRTNMIDTLTFLSNSPNDYNATYGSDEMATMAFGLKQATRPNPTVVYQDVNFYNYRTKIATKVDYGTVTLTFYDDVNNRAHDIFAAYLNTISPISTIADMNSADRFDQMGITPEDFKDPNSSGVLQPTTNSNVGGDTTNTFDVSSLGALEDNLEAGLIQCITLTQHLPNQYITSNATVSVIDAEGNVAASSTNQSGQKAVSAGVQYCFYNPRIINMTLDDLDMTASEISTVALTFAYDAVYVNKVYGNAGSGKFEQATTQKDKSLFGKFLSSIDDSINPALQGANNAVKALNASTAATQIKSVTAGLF